MAADEGRETGNCEFLCFTTGEPCGDAGVTTTRELRELERGNAMGTTGTVGLLVEAGSRGCWNSGGVVIGATSIGVKKESEVDSPNGLNASASLVNGFSAVAEVAGKVYYKKLVY